MRFIAILFFISFTSLLFGQAGVIVYAGPSFAFSPDDIVTGSGEAHFGYVIGANARINSDPMYFLVTGELGGFDFLSNKKFGIIGGNDLSYLKGKIGLGFDVKRISNRITIRSKVQGSLMFVNDFDQKLLETPKYLSNGYTDVNDGIAGLSTCVGITHGNMLYEIEYEQGLFNIFKDKKTSKINFLNLTAGYQF
jgi:hypothetical protein